MSWSRVLLIKNLNLLDSSLQTLNYFDVKTLSVFESGKIKTLYLKLAIKGTVSNKLGGAKSDGDQIL